MINKLFSDLMPLSERTEARWWNPKKPIRIRFKETGKDWRTETIIEIHSNCLIFEGNKTKPYWAIEEYEIY